MTNIIIYTTEETLNHKKGLKKGEEDYTHFFWELSKVPKKLNDCERNYFATEGFIKGYFVIEDLDVSYGCKIEWNPASWKNIKPIPTKSFQGFKYSDKVGGLD